MAMVAIRNPIGYYTPAHGVVKKISMNKPNILVSLADFISDIDKWHIRI